MSSDVVAEARRYAEYHGVKPWTEHIFALLKVIEGGRWEHDEVIFGDEDEAPLVEAKRFVGRWVPCSEHERENVGPDE